MKSKIITAIVLSTAITTLSPLKIKAEGGCSNYPFNPMGTKFEAREDGKFTLLVTMDQGVRADDNNLRMKAQKIALMRGKKEISDFVKQKISGKDSFSSEFVEDSVTGPEGVEWSSEDATSLMEEIATSSENVIRGIIPLNSCYEPGKYVRVTVGIKPETMQAAGSTDATSKGPFKGYKNPTSQASNEQGVEADSRSLQPYNTVGGYGTDTIDF